MRKSLAIVLAAGEGKRMRSAQPKVLHPIGGLPMIAHVLKALKAAEVDRVAVVVAPGHEAVGRVVAEHAPGAEIFVQQKPRGTADAVRAARAALEAGADDVLVVFGDTPFVSAETVKRVRSGIAEGAAVVVGGMMPADPKGYGRLLMQGDQLVAIREERDASDAERKIGFVNGGVMGLDGGAALAILDAIGSDNAQGEFYLTDAVAVRERARAQGCGDRRAGRRGVRHQRSGAACGGGAPVPGAAPDRRRWRTVRR